MNEMRIILTKNNSEPEGRLSKIEQNKQKIEKKMQKIKKHR